MIINFKPKIIYLLIYWFICISIICLFTDIKYFFFTLVFIFVISYFLGMILFYLLRLEIDLKNYFTILSSGLAIIIVLFNFWFMLNIEINILLLRIFFGVLFLYGVYLFYKEFLKDMSIVSNSLININCYVILLSVIISILFFIVFIPLNNLFVAPLHDPVALSIISKRIGEGQFSLRLLDNDMSIYPNGLAIIVSLISNLFQLDYAKELLYLTNLFNALIGVSFFYFGKELFKDIHGGLVLLFVSMFISLYPLSLYYMAGKNAQIIGFYLSIFTASYLLKLVNNNEMINRNNIIILSLLTAGSHYAHYNSTVFLIGIFISVFIVEMISNRKKQKTEEKLLICYGKVALLTLILLIPNILVLVTVDGIKFDEISKFNPSQITVKSFFNSFYYHLDLTSGKFLKNIWWIGLGSIMPIIVLKKTNYLKIFSLLLLFLIWIMFTTSGLAEKLNLFFISSSFSAMLTFIPIVLIFSSFLWIIFSLFSKKYKYIFYILLFVCSIISGSWRINKYFEAKKYSVVKKEDIKAFEWINKNIMDNKYFVGRIEFLNTSFLTDAALYLPYYCDKDIFLNFVRTKNFNRENNEDIELYKDWVKNLNRKISVNRLLKKHIKYIYLSNKPVFGWGYLKKEYLDNNKELYEKIYSKNNIGIWKIKGIGINNKS